MTKREKYIVYNLKLDTATVKAVSEIGRIAGTHKYDVWIAREVKKDNNLLNNTKDIYFILDWVKKDKPDILTLNFKESFEQATEWHKNLKFKEPEKIEESNPIEERIIFKCQDKEHFFIILKPGELIREGTLMRHCVGSYKEKVLQGRSLIISLRDKENEPHITLEIDTKTRTVVQIRGKSNTDPAKKYLKMITEFAVYATGSDKSVDEELLELMYMRFD